MQDLALCSNHVGLMSCARKCLIAFFIRVILSCVLGLFSMSMDNNLYLCKIFNLSLVLCGCKVIPHLREIFRFSCGRGYGVGGNRRLKQRA
jgi:hypothetical protein